MTRKNSNLYEEYDKIVLKIKKVRPEFIKKVRKIAKENHAIPLIVPLKKRKRAIEKAITEKDGDMSKVTDILRCSIISKVYGRINDIEREIKNEFEVVNIKNRFNDPGKMGYRDILMNVRLGEVIAEIQIHVLELLKTKEYLNHLFYEIERAIDNQAKKDNRDFYSWEEYIKHKITEIERYSNDQAWGRQKSLERGENPKSMLFIVTHDRKKYQEAKLFVPTIKWIKMDIPKIQTSDIKELVLKKAFKALKYVDARIILEGVSLKCTGLDDLPGPLHRIFIKNLGLEKFARLVISTGNTGVEAVSCICLVESPSRIHFFQGVVKGDIVMPRGKPEIGWDAIFQPKGYKKTYAEMNLEEKNKTNMRKISFDKLIDYLHKNGSNLVV